MDIFEYRVTIYVEEDTKEQANKKAEYALNVACSEDHQEDTRLYSWDTLNDNLGFKIK